MLLLILLVTDCATQSGTIYQVERTSTLYVYGKYPRIGRYVLAQARQIDSRREHRETEPKLAHKTKGGSSQTVHTSRLQRQTPAATNLHDSFLLVVVTLFREGKPPPPL